MNIETTEELINRLANEVRDSGKLVADLLASVTLERDQLRAKLAEYDGLLCECDEYFDNRADADMDQDGYIPNEEMKMLTAIRARSRMGGENE